MPQSALMIWMRFILEREYSMKKFFVFKTVTYETVVYAESGEHAKEIAELLHLDNFKIRGYGKALGEPPEFEVIQICRNPVETVLDNEKFETCNFVEEA